MESRRHRRQHVSPLPHERAVALRVPHRAHGPYAPARAERPRRRLLAVQRRDRDSGAVHPAASRGGTQQVGGERKGVERLREARPRRYLEGARGQAPRLLVPLALPTMSTLPRIPARLAAAFAAALCMTAACGPSNASSANVEQQTRESAASVAATPRVTAAVASGTASSDTNRLVVYK